MPGWPRSGARSKSGKVGEPSALRKSPLSATRKLSAMVVSLLLVPLGLGPQLADRGGERVVQDPHIARIADEIEAALVELDALLDGRHQPAQRLAVLAGGGHDFGDGLGEFRVLELAGNAERDAEIEMPDPQAVDARHGRYGVGVLDPLGG